MKGGAFLVAIVVAAAGAQPARQPAAQAPVQLGTRVQPETVTVGERFTLMVRVRAPEGSTIEFPAGPDSGAVELLGTVVIAPPRTDTTRRQVAGVPPFVIVRVEQLAGYRLTAWDTGTQPLRLGDVIVRSSAGEQRLPLAALNVFVRSVLPADTTLHVPKPARALFGLGLPAWLWWLLAALALLLVLLLAWWLWRRRRRRREMEVPPFEWAQREFGRIEATRLPDAGKGAQHAALMTDVAREYLWRRLADIRSSQTSRELLAAARSSPDARWDTSVHARAGRLLARTDLAKFAAAPVSVDEARELGTDARWLVEETERRITAPEERAVA